jgi:predicted lipoprotein
MLNRISAAGACAAKVTALALLASCTIVRHGATGGAETAEQKAASDQGFDAAAYVESNWAGKIEPEVVKNAVELRDILAALKKDPEGTRKKYGLRQDETAQYNFMVKGREPIKAVNTESAAGTLELAVPDLSGEGGACVQIGPVVKSTAVRDVLSFIHFGDFTNQLDFANISKSINFHVRDKVVAGIKEKARPGKKLFFVGAFSEDPGGKVLITPVQIRVEE